MSEAREMSEGGNGRRRGVGLAVVAAIAVGALAGIAASDDEAGGYKVRAVFDNGSFVIPGEDVKIAGVVVGAIHDVDLTEQNQAAVVLQIDDPAFVPFRRDASCEIRLQSLIGEQFIECRPTKPQADGELAPPLRKIESGRGEGQHLLPVDNNMTPVGVDLLGNINRLPQREGLRLILNEFGAGMAGNGKRLRAAVRRANPALRETDRVIKILADQNELLARLVDESDRVLEPWAGKRSEMADFIDKAGETAAAAAARGDAMEENFARFPAFLRELSPTMRAFSGMADQMTPALNSLDSEGDAISKTVQRLGPFTSSATPALVSLGDFADQGRRLFPAIEPLARDLRGLGKPLRPTADDLAKLFNSFDETGGIEELMQLIYYYTGAVNGEDEFGHYVRSALSLTPCSARQPVSEGSCSANFRDRGTGNSSSVSQMLAAGAADTGSSEALERDADAIGYDLESDRAEPLLDYLFGPGGKGEQE